jgi:hypothetical protein
MDFEGILVVDLPILRYPFADVRHHALYLFDSAESTSAVVVKFLLSHEATVCAMCISLYKCLTLVAQSRMDLLKKVPSGAIYPLGVKSLPRGGSSCTKVLASYVIGTSRWF